MPMANMTEQLGFCKLYKLKRHMALCTPCLPRKGWFFALVFVSVSITFGIVFFDRTFARKLRSQTIEETVAVMRTRLKFLETQYRGRQQEVADEQARVENGCKPQVHGNDVSNVTYPPELTAYLKEISGIALVVQDGYGNQYCIPEILVLGGGSSRLNQLGSKASDGLLSQERPEVIKAPFSLRIMSHLLDDPDSLRPAYHMRTGKQFADYIIGVPHVRRDKETYLFETIRVLLDKMTDVDKNLTMIVVMIGETNITYVVETAHQIEKSFPEAIAAGLIDVISPNDKYYPDLDSLPLTLGDSKKRVKWRTKQNLDAIFLMAFAYSRCLYYLMIEDDVLAADGYMTQIRSYTAETTVSIPDWFFIQYSTTGGIGKLFRSTDLIHFMTYVQLFYLNMPIDWLTESYLSDRNCGINKGAGSDSEPSVLNLPTTGPILMNNMSLDLDYYNEDIVNIDGNIETEEAPEADDFDDQVDDVMSFAFNKNVNDTNSQKSPRKKDFEKECAEAKTKIRPTYKKNLFKHIGLYSSLKGKIQKVKDTIPQKTPDFFPHNNPPIANIKCDPPHHLNHTILNAYLGQTYFWGKNPAKDDVIEFWFLDPSKFDRYLVRSGNPDHANDKISNAVFEVLPVASTRNDTFETIDRFDEFGMVEGQIDATKYGDLYAMRIRFEQPSKYWIAITEIEFVSSSANAT